MIIEILIPHRPGRRLAAATGKVREEIMARFLKPFCAKIFFSVVLALIASTLAAQASVVWGPGNDNCARLTEESSGDTSRFHMEMSWIAGFISAQNEDFAVNAAEKGINPQLDVDILRGMDNSILETWIVRYCSANPQSDLLRAAAALSKDLFDRLTARMKAATPQ